MEDIQKVFTLLTFTWDYGEKKESDPSFCYKFLD